MLFILMPAVCRHFLFPVISIPMHSGREICYNEKEISQSCLLRNNVWERTLFEMTGGA